MQMLDHFSLGPWLLWDFLLGIPGGLRANIITFGAAMHGCHKAGEWQQVLQLFEDLQIKALQVRPVRMPRCQWSLEKSNQQNQMRNPVECPVVSILRVPVSISKNGTRILK